MALVVPLLGLSSGNTPGDTFEASGPTTVRWEVAAAEDSTCYFHAALVGVEGDEVVSYDLVADTTVMSRRTARQFRLPDRASGEVQLELEPGTYRVSVFSQHMRHADGSVEGCESWDVSR